MYSYEQRVTAVKLLIQYDMSYTTVIQELGYPNNSKTLKYWYKEYGVEGDLHKAYAGGSKYTDEQKQAAVTYYLEHGRCISRACRKLGYPSREVLGQWIDELAPEQRKRCRTSSADVEYPQEVKEQAVIDLCARDGSAQDVADCYGVSRYSLYNWRKQLLGDGRVAKVKREPKNAVKSISDNVSELRDEVARLKVEAESLNREIYRLQLERDVLEKAAEIIKKDQGVNLKTLTNHEKAVVIDALRDKYRLKELLEVFHMSKSSYCYQRAAMRAPDKYESVTIEIRKIFDDSKGRYGYRRINVLLKKKGIIISEKVVRRIMKKEGMIVRCKRRRKYNSYQGEITPAVENIIARDFHSEAPNEKWLTDITEFHIPAGKIYLSPVIDCFDGLPVSWTISTSPDAELVNTMLDLAIAQLKDGEHPIVHSDRGAHYRWPGWIDRMDAAELTRSMSKKGCSPDNSACEGFFGRLKNEMFYGYSWEGISVYEFIDILDEYMHWYAEDRIKLSLDGMSPVEYRQSLGLIA